MKRKKLAIIFHESLTWISGGERFMYEEAKFLEEYGLKVIFLTFAFDSNELFFVLPGGYQPHIEVLNKKGPWAGIWHLRKRIKQLKPEIIITHYPLNCRFLYPATLFTKFSYFLHIFSTMFWFTSQQDLTKYSFLYRKVFDKIRNSTPGHKEFIFPRAPQMNLIEKIRLELLTLLVHLGVRKAKKIFVFSKQMKWEVKLLYGKEAIILKGAYPENILSYKQNKDIKRELGIVNKKMILNINTLQSRKRVDLLIKAFKIISKKLNNCVLIIGGKGPEEMSLKKLASELNISDKVEFVGRIDEEDLWDFYKNCDIFVHPNWADFVLTIYEALALGKRIVCSSEMEFDDCLKDYPSIFIAEPTIDDFARAIEEALKTKVDGKIDRKILARYSWEYYFKRVLEELGVSRVKEIDYEYNF
jgi:glycosyltransferase involved in cell wall biosynthesis